jgi:D-apionolactonase
VFNRATPATPANLVTLARQNLGPRAMIYAGSSKFFTEVNCNRPDRALLRQIDGLCFGLNPQVHAFDDTSLIETAEMQAETLRSARTFAGSLPLAVTPVTLKPRYSLADPGPEPDEATSQADPRHWALFGAVWTVASLANLAQADSLTLYETAGPRGVIDTGGGLAFPLYHVLADVAEFGGAVVPVRSSAPLRVQALLQRKERGSRRQWLVANLSATPECVRLDDLPKTVRLAMLDEHTVERAVRAPLDYRAEPPQRVTTQGGALDLALPPYAVARIT